MLRSLIVVLVFALILLPACNKNEEIEVEIPVWVEVQALFPAEVAGEKCNAISAGGKEAVVFYDEKGRNLGAIELSANVAPPQSYCGWVSNVKYGDNLCIEYGDCKPKLDELRNEGVEIDMTANTRDINGFKVHFGQHHRSGYHVRLAVLRDDFYVYCCWEKRQDLDPLFTEFLESMDVETLTRIIGEQSGITGQA